MPHFPVLAKLSQILERKVEKVREEERGQRQDLHVLATSYSGQLKAKTPNMIRESDFHHVGDKVGDLKEMRIKKQTLKYNLEFIDYKTRILLFHKFTICDILVSDSISFIYMLCTHLIYFHSDYILCS